MGRTPTPPLRTFFCSKMPKNGVFLPPKHLFFGKNKLRIWGVPPFTDFFPVKKGVTDLGGTPPPLRKKSAK